MKLIITETIGGLIEITKNVVKMTIYPFDTGVGAIQESLLTAKGSMIAASAAATPAEILVGNDGEVLTADAASAGGVKWAAGGGATTQEMNNNSGTSMAVGDVVCIDTDNDNSVILTTIPDDLRACGVAAATISDGALGAINTLQGTVLTIKVDAGAVNRGEYLATSSTSGRAKSVGYFNQYAAFALALSGKAAGSVGTVTAMLLSRVPFAIKGTTAWATGGDNASTGLTNTQKFIMASATWATISGAALPVGKSTLPLGMGNTNISGIAIAGTGLTTSYKMLYSAETFSANAGMNLATNASYLGSGMNSPLKGYRAGGYHAAWTTASEKFDFSADTRAAITSMSAADTGRHAGTDGSFIHIVKTTGGWKITVASDSGAVSAGLVRATTYVGGSQSYPATAAYAVEAATCVKIDFASGNQSTLGSSPASNHRYTPAVTDGIAFGWACGDNTSPYSAADKFTKSGEVWSVDSGAQMPTPKGLYAAFNNGAY